MGEEAWATDSSHGVTSFLGVERRTVSVDMTSGLEVDPVESTNKKVGKSGTENIYPRDLIGSYNLDYHSMAKDTVAPTKHRTKNDMPCETAEILRYLIGAINTYLDGTIHHSITPKNSLDLIAIGGKTSGGKIGHISEVGYRSASPVETEGREHTPALVGVLGVDGNMTLYT